jgi:ribonuclease HII
MLNLEQKYFKRGYKNILGGDEAGRGPLAGPVSVGVVLATKETFKKLKRDLKDFPVRDSKKLSPKQRQVIYNKILTFPYIKYACAFESNKIIDKLGIEEATRRAFGKCLKKIKAKPNIILYDGNRPIDKKLKIKQVFIIHGDDKVFLISLASIIAKVVRDTYMIKLSSKYPRYSFATHKGYGTPKHIKAIKKYGVSNLHRKSYLGKLIVK